MNSNLKAHLAILTANVMFAVNYSYSKSIIPDWMLPEGLCIARIISAAFIFVAIYFAWVRERIERRDLFLLVLASLFGIGGNQYLFLQGLNLTSPVDSAIIATTGPVLVLILSAILRRDKITLLKSVGIAIGACGAILVILYGGIVNFSSGHLRGNMLVFSSAFSYACYLIVVRDLMKKYSPLTIMAWIFGVSALVMTPWLWDDLSSGTPWAEIPPYIWGSIVFVLVGATWIAYICVAISLKKLKPTTVSIYSYSQPIIASFVAIVRSQDTISWVKIVAALLVFAGVFIVTQSYRFEKS